MSAVPASVAAGRLQAGAVTTTGSLEPEADRRGDRDQRRRIQLDEQDAGLTRASDGESASTGAAGW
jgi:hypothetical protein